MNLRPLATGLMRGLGLFYPLRDLRRDWRFRRKNAAALRRWRAAGRPMPAPDQLKYEVLRHYGRKHGIKILVETGTFYGDAVFALRREFREIHTIELAPGLYEHNRHELEHLPHIHLHFGDSAVVLPRLVSRLTDRSLLARRTFLFGTVGPWRQQHSGYRGAPLSARTTTGRSRDVDR